VLQKSWLLHVAAHIIAELIATAKLYRYYNNNNYNYYQYYYYHYYYY